MLVSITASIMAGVRVFLSFEKENSSPTKNISMIRPMKDRISTRLVSVIKPLYSTPRSSTLIFGPISMPITMYPSMTD